MKRKIAILGFIALVVFFGGMYFNYILGWIEFRESVSTPNKFLSSVTINKYLYKRDSFEIIKQLRGSLLDHKDFFDNSAYDDSTQLIVDSIVYSSDYNRLAVLVLTKNPVQKQLVPDQRYSWYYDATCYLGIRRTDTVILRWLGPVYTNAYNREVISKDIRNAIFITFARKDTSKANIYRYNLNDVRFWKSIIWERYFDKVG